jgi:integrase
MRVQHALQSGCAQRLSRFARGNESQQHQIEKWLDGKSYSHQTRLNYLRDLALLFNSSITHGWTASKSAATIEKSADVTTLSPAEVSQLLKHCPKNILPGAAIKIFSGLRTSELLSLDWAQEDSRV